VFFYGLPRKCFKFWLNLSFCQHSHLAVLCVLFILIFVLQDHLVCFMGGTLALATHNGLSDRYMEMGKQLTETCWEMYRQMPTGLSPEIVYFNTNPESREDLIVKVGIFVLVAWQQCNLHSVFKKRLRGNFH
jgi:Glycosyl hydrolase family 47